MVFLRAQSVACVLAKSGRASGSGRHAATISACSHSGHPVGTVGRWPAHALRHACVVVESAKGTW